MRWYKLNCLIMHKTMTFTAPINGPFTSSGPDIVREIFLLSVHNIVIDRQTCNNIDWKYDVTGRQLIDISRFLSWSVDWYTVINHHANPYASFSAYCVNRVTLYKLFGYKIIKRVLIYFDDNALFMLWKYFSIIM